MPKSRCTQTLADGRSQCSRNVWFNNNCQFHANRAAKKERDDLHTAGAAEVWPTLVKGDIVRVFGHIKATKQGSCELPWVWMIISEMSENKANLWPLNTKTVQGESDPVTHRWTIYPDPDSPVHTDDLKFVAHPNGKVIAPISNIQLFNSQHRFFLSDNGRRCTGMDLRWTKWADKNSGLECMTSCD